MGNNRADMQSDLYKAIDDLVRNHDRREPYISNVVQRIYWLVKDGLPVDRVTSQSDYKKGYSAGYATATNRLKRTTKVTGLVPPDLKANPDSSNSPTEATQERKDIPND